MANAKVVTIKVKGGPKTQVPWSKGMSALKAMELARDMIGANSKARLTFGVQYYGSSLGYLVKMINETYDSFLSRGSELASPCFYWRFLVNGAPAPMSVDRAMLKRGDVISFEFVPASV